MPDKCCMRVIIVDMPWLMAQYVHIIGHIYNMERTPMRSYAIFAGLSSSSNSEHRVGLSNERSYNVYPISVGRLSSLLIEVVLFPPALRLHSVLSVPFVVMSEANAL